MKKVSQITTGQKTALAKKRVAAYCRVSTNSADQLNSYARQVKTYTDRINKNNEWELVEIFADEGLSGTSSDKREEFLRMIRLCELGQIDLILVKSISRFGRNAREVLDYVRKLKDLGVAVQFDKEGIYTLTLGDEMLLNTFAAIAEEESVSISQNVRFSIKKKMEDGTYVNGCVPYGFRLIDGVMTPYEDEAIIVRTLFKHYLEGYSTVELARWLEAEGVLTKNGNNNWNIRIISLMLGNEKYVGDSLYHKKFREETVPFKSRINYGEMEQIYYPYTHQGIVDRETFDKVQVLLNKRRESFARNKAEVPKNYPLSKKIRCAECGSLFRRRIVNGCISWGCTTHIGDCTKCDSHYYREERIYDRIVGIINRLHFGNFNILDETEHLLQMAIVARRRTSTDAMNASQSIAELNAKLLMLENLRSKGYITADVYTSQAREIKRETDRLKAQREELCESKYDKVLAEIKKLRKALERLDEPLEEFNEELFIEIVKSVEINNRDEMTVTLLGDIAITELL